MSTNTRVVNGPGFKIRYDDEPGYLRAYVHDGTDSLEITIAMWRMLGSECIAVGADKLLVLEDLSSTVPMQDMSAVIDVIEHTGYAKTIRTAFVELRDDIQGAELAEIMCRERGITARIFSSEDLARRWLLFDD